MFKIYGLPIALSVKSRFLNTTYQSLYDWNPVSQPYLYLLPYYIERFAVPWWVMSSLTLGPVHILLDVTAFSSQLFTLEWLIPIHTSECDLVTSPSTSPWPALHLPSWESWFRRSFTLSKNNVFAWFSPLAFKFLKSKNCGSFTFASPVPSMFIFIKSINFSDQFHSNLGT